MFCFQCQEAAGNKGCTVRGVCGKPEKTANLQDVLIYTLKGIAVVAKKAAEVGIHDKETGLFVARALFSTITNRKRIRRPPPPLGNLVCNRCR